jgi:hypothetical protein
MSAHTYGLELFHSAARQSREQRFLEIVDHPDSWMPPGIPETRFHFKRSVEVWPRREHFAPVCVQLRTHRQRRLKALFYNILAKVGSNQRGCVVSRLTIPYSLQPMDFRLEK